LNLNEQPNLPFEPDYFDVVTMLAVAEHLNPASLERLLQEAHRTLRPGGHLIITTPAAWSDGLLHAMAKLNLVSEEEINEHVYAYTLPLLGWYFGRAGFEMGRVRFGYFELGLNMWAIAER
jgi:SAM-dependent methyltransferase